MHGWARNHTEREWAGGHRLEPHQTDREGGFWEPCRAKAGDTEAKLLNRVAVLNALNLPPRDPRWWNPKREAGWNNSSPLWSRYIPVRGSPLATALPVPHSGHDRVPDASEIFLSLLPQPVS